MRDESSDGLIERAKAGSPEALNVLYARISPRLLAYIRLRLGRDLRARLESRDILQVTLLKSCQKLHEFRGSETRSLIAWLARIAEHEIRDCADHAHVSGATRRARPASTRVPRCRRSRDRPSRG